MHLIIALCNHVWCPKCSEERFSQQQQRVLGSLYAASAGDIKVLGNFRLFVASQTTWLVWSYDYIHNNDLHTTMMNWFCWFSVELIELSSPYRVLSYSYGRLTLWLSLPWAVITLCISRVVIGSICLGNTWLHMRRDKMFIYLCSLSGSIAHSLKTNGDASPKLRLKHMQTLVSLIG